MIANVSKTGTTYLVLYDDLQEGTTEPTQNTRNYVLINAYEDATEANRPKLTVTWNFTPAIGQATETDTAQAISVNRVRYFALGQATETDLAQPIGHYKTRALGQATETDTAGIITPTLSERKPAAYISALRLDAGKSDLALKAEKDAHYLTAWPRP